MREAAAKALEAMGAAAAPHTPAVAALLQHSDVYVRGKAVQALGAMGAAAAPHEPAVAALLQDSNRDVRWAAAIALGEMRRAAAASHTPAVAALLQGWDEDVRLAAAQALEAMGAAVAPYYAPVSIEVRLAAAQALGAMGAAAASHTPAITNLLQDLNRDVRLAAAQALGAMGAAAAPHAPAIAALLQDSNMDVRGKAAQALGAMGAAAAPHAPAIIALLQHSDVDVRGKAVQALGAMGAAAAPHAPAIAALLQDSDVDVRGKAAQALGAMSELDIESIVHILDPLYNDSSYTAELQLLAYRVSGGKERNITLITWLGRDEETIYDYLKHLKHKNGIHILEVFAEVWSVSGVSYKLRNDLVQRISQVVQEVKWKSDDLALLKRHQENLKKIRSPQQITLTKAISDIQTKKRLGSMWIPGSYVSNNSRIEPSKAFPRRLTLWTNSKKPKYSGKYVCERPRCGRNHDLNRDQNPSMVLTWTSQKPSPSSSRAYSPALWHTRSWS